MSRSQINIALVSCLTIFGCSSNKDSGIDEEYILPQAGQWTVETSGWTNDDCNAQENLTGISSIVIADVAESNFSLTFFDGSVRIGENSSTCTYSSDDTYTCEDFDHTTSYDDIDATINMIGVSFSLEMTSETTTSGRGDLVLSCSGADCGFVAASTTTGELPCGTTINFTASAD
jgi:hypothetical protein